MLNFLPADFDDAAFGAGDGAFDGDEVDGRVDFHDLAGLEGLAGGAHVAWHFFAGPDAGGECAGADGAGAAVADVAVGGGCAVEPPAFDDALEAAAAGDGGDVDEGALGEDGDVDQVAFLFLFREGREFALGKELFVLGFFTFGETQY